MGRELELLALWPTGTTTPTPPPSRRDRQPSRAGAGLDSVADYSRPPHPTRLAPRNSERITSTAAANPLPEGTTERAIRLIVDPDHTDHPAAAGPFWASGTVGRRLIDRGPQRRAGRLNPTTPFPPGHQSAARRACRTARPRTLQADPG